MTNANQQSTVPSAQNPQNQINDGDDLDDDGPRQQRGGKRGPSSADQLAEIGKLLRGEADDQGDQDDSDQGDQDGDDQPPQGRRAPRTLDEVAKALGIDVAALYELELPERAAAGENKGKRLKLGQLKDYYARQDDHALDRITWEETRDREQASIARERQELSELMAAIPADKLNQETLNAVRLRIDGVVKAERRKTLQRIPTWADDNTRTVELQGIAEHLADYGFPAAALQGISDHRMLAYMRDNWLRMRRLQDALDKVKPVRTPGTPRSRATGAAPAQVRPQQSQSSTRSLNNQVSAVSKLLRGS